MSPATRKPDWRSGPALAGYALAVTALLTAVYAGTQPHIAASEARARRALMAEVLPPAQHDNDLLQAAFTLPPTPELGVQRSGTAWRAMRGGQTVAVVLEAIAPDGYAGPIRLLIGIDRSGRLTGVRVLAHRETPGLGDYIEVGRGPWILQFAGSSL